MDTAVCDAGTTIAAFLDAAAARRPTPGGGAAAALTGALGAAMLEMVLQYSLGRKDLASHEASLRDIAAQGTRARRLLTALMEEDQAAYLAMTEARRLPAESPQRQPRQEAALLACVRAPQSIAATALAVLELCERAVDICNRHLLSDLAVSVDLSVAAIRAAVCNIRVNLDQIAEIEERRRIAGGAESLLLRATALAQRLSPRIWSRAST